MTPDDQRPVDAETALADAPAGHKDELRLWLRLLTTATMVETEIRRRLRVQFETTLPRFDLLAQLQRAGPLTLGEVSRRMMVSNGNVTGLATRLEAEGLIERRVNAADRREVSLALTARGRALIETVLPRVVDFWNTTLEGFSATEIRQMIRLLTRLTAAAEGNRLAEKPRQRNHGRIGRRIHASGPQA